MQFMLHKKSSGFTLIEIMLVIALIGIIATMVQFSFGSEKPEDKLQQESERFAARFSLASDYGMLNNVELGLMIIGDNKYQFLGYDGVSWTTIPDQQITTTFTLPEGIVFSLKLDDLPIEEPTMVDTKLLRQAQEAQDELNGIEKDKQLIPQVYIFSGGDISPFSLTFLFSEQFPQYQGLSYTVTGLYDSNLSIEGHIENE